MANTPFTEHKRSGFDVFLDAMRGVHDVEACRRVAAKEAEGKSREELVEFIADMLFGIANFRQTVINTHLFGSPDARL